VVTVWPAGRRARLLAFPLVIEIGYDLVLQAVYIKSMRHRHGAKGRLEQRPSRGGAARRDRALIFLAGILFPSSVLHSGWFRSSPPSSR
jgi:hypothetical protein